MMVLCMMRMFPSQRRWHRLRKNSWWSVVGLFAATTLLCAPCFAFSPQEHSKHQHGHAPQHFSVFRHRSSFLTTLSLLEAPQRAVILRSRRNNQQDGNPSEDDAPSLPFGIPSLDLRRSSQKTPPKRQEQTDLPFGFSIESSAALEQLILDSVAPVENALDSLTGDWALSYADLTPDSTRTIAGQAFLVTNVAYLIAGIYIFMSGDLWFGFWTDMAAIASFNYHYNQLLASGKTKAASVRLALLLDYTAAAFSILTAAAYILSFSIFPVQAVGVSVAGLVFLYMSWVYEYGRPYMCWHSLWHLCSAYSGYLIGTLHAAADR